MCNGNKQIVNETDLQVYALVKLVRIGIIIH
ncbi:MAG: hypothetical protein CM1200mP40_26490 [Gammaproteobacteria bacterium]|nr:MAG: hypothetical protein CM1200mP40_26490 [Gammaproteobacteria bacterium]